MEFKNQKHAFCKLINAVIKHQLIQHIRKKVFPNTKFYQIQRKKYLNKKKDSDSFLTITFILCGKISQKKKLSQVRN